jgi:hypothetical protein
MSLGSFNAHTSQAIVDRLIAETRRVLSVLVNAQPADIPARRIYR